MDMKPMCPMCNKPTGSMSEVCPDCMKKMGDMMDPGKMDNSKGMK